MVNTRSQTTRSRSTDMSGMDRYSDAESEDSVPDSYKRTNGRIRHAVKQRFSEMNRQISELTYLVLVLTEKISSSFLFKPMRN